MNDTSSNNGKNLGARVTEAGEALGERVQSATAATAAAAGQAQKIVEDAAAATSTRRSGKKSIERCGRSGAGRRRRGTPRDQIRFAADRREAADHGSGRLRARLRRELVDSRTR
jgi:hypothetical protein